MNAIAGKRFLVAEDDQLIAMLLVALLTEQGAAEVDRAATLKDALARIVPGAYDAALFDVKLGSELSFPAAQLAREQGIPILFTSGYASFDRPIELADVQVLAKPYLVGDAVDTISKLFTAPAEASTSSIA